MNSQPLGLVHEVGPQVLASIREIESVDLSGARSRMCVDFPTDKDLLDRVEREVRRFLALAVLSDGSHKVVIGEKIDTLWHYFILHTQEYRGFCGRVFGGYLNHVPILPDQKSALASDYDKTRRLYEAHFGPPPSDLWGDHDQICWGGCDEFVDRQDQDSRSRAMALN